jgi:hypothetical protein
MASLVTYDQDEIHDPALSRVIDSLTPGGFFIIAIHENLPLGLPPSFHFPFPPASTGKLQRPSRKIGKIFLPVFDG